MKKQDLPNGDRDSNDIEQEVRKRVKELKEFYAHLASYLLINALLIVINLLTSSSTFWAIWPLMGWGVGLASHAVSVFGLFGIGNKAWEERKVRELILQRQRGLSAEQVRQLLREEVYAEKQSAPSRADWERVLLRLANLETIVTSKDWNFMENLSEPARAPESNGDSNNRQEEKDSAEQSANLARRIQ